MIIDSHAHYNSNAYKKPFRYLSYDENGYALKEGDREQLLQEMKGISPDEVERTTTENTIRLFQLPITAEDQPR